jgi:TolA-binding protein
MFFAEALSPTQLVLVGLMILVGAFVLRRSTVLSQRSKARDVAGEARREMRHAEQTVSSRIRKLEVRLYDYGREVEGRLHTKIVQLDRLIVDADREIDRLQQLVDESRQGTPSTGMKAGPDIIGPAAVPHPSISSGALPACNSSEPSRLGFPKRRMIVRLSQAGYSADEIARILERSRHEVREVLEEENRSGRADAA